MIRVTENIKFNMITNNIASVSSQYGDLMEKLSTQKNINRPSDDPIGTNDILDYRTALNAIEQYQSNITDANISLSIAETNLSGLRDIVSEAMDIVINESGSGASAETRQSSLATLNALIDEALSLLNTKNGDSYLFGGSATDVKPFSSTYSSASVGDAVAASTNTYSGSVTSSGTYTETENKSYVIRIVDGGTLNDATYKVSTDGGVTWGATSAVGDLTSGTLSNIGGDGIDITFDPGTFAVNDTFSVSGRAAGYYNGNNDKLYTVIGTDNQFAYNITGAEAFTGQFAKASVTNGGAGITNDDTIVLTSGATAGNWAITSQTSYPAMSILSQTSDTLTIDADGDATPDITVNLTGSWRENDTIELSLSAGVTSGEVSTTFSGSGSIDLLSTLNALKSALEETDQTRAEDLIAAQLDNLTKAETQMLQYETQTGAKMNSLELSSSNHDSLNLQITNMLSDIENADLTELITEFLMKQVAMQASYSMASKIGEMTIMEYI